MIPPWNLSGVLPPFVGKDPTVGAGMSPYPVTMEMLATKLCATQERSDLFRKFTKFRTKLRAVGFSQGVQLIDGSFCTNIEGLESRAPRDIDLVSILVPPSGIHSHAAAVAWQAANPDIFNRATCKATYGCDNYFVDGRLPVLTQHRQLAYWIGLFCHQRVSNLWKGVLMVDLQDDDAKALSILPHPPPASTPSPAPVMS